MVKGATASATRHFALLHGNSARRAFLTDRAGATAIEFAMIAVPFIGLIAAVFETGAIYFRTAQLQMTTERASRAVLTHSTAANLKYGDFVKQNICTWKTTGTVVPGTLSTMFDCDKIMVDVRKATSWNSANTANDIFGSPNDAATAIAMPGPGDIAVVRIAYPMTAVTSILSGGVFSGQSFGQNRSGQMQYNSKWTHMLLGVYAFRVEP